MRPLLPLAGAKMGPTCPFHGFVPHLRAPDGPAYSCVYCLHGLDLPPEAEKALQQAERSLDRAETALARARQTMAG